MKISMVAAAAFISLLCPAVVEAQWGTPIVQPFPAWTVTNEMSAVDARVVWCLGLNFFGVSNLFARTTDGGDIWQAGTISGAGNLDNGSITAVDSLTAWVTKRDLSRTTSGGVFKTTDGGLTWLRQTTAFAGAGASPMFVHFWNADTGLVVGERTGTSWEIYTTTNGGSTWTPVPLANIPPIAGDALTEGFEYEVVGNTFWFCTSTGRVYRSRDRGETWTAAAIGPGYGRVHTVAFQDQNIGLGSSFVNGNPTTVKTTDGGDTWFPIAPPTVPTPHILRHVPGTSGVYVVTGHVWPGTLTGSAYTTNGGESWTNIDNADYGILAFVAPNVGWVGHLEGSQSSMRKWIGTALTYVSPSSINFGTMQLGHSSDTSSVAISRVVDPFVVSTIAHSQGAYSLINVPSLPATIPPFGSMQFEVVFRPTVQGVVEDTLVIQTNHPTNPIVRIPLRGKGWGTFAVAQENTMYGTSAGSPEGGLYTINTATGGPIAIGSLGIPEIQSIAVDAVSNQVYGTFSTTTKTSFYHIDMASGNAVYMRSISVGNLRAVTFSRGDTLYGGTTTGSLYRINLTTGDATLVGTASGLVYSGLSFRPTRNQLWASVRLPMDSIYTVNTTTGVATFVGMTGFNSFTSSIAFSPSGTLFSLIDNGSGEYYLASLDTITAVGSIIAGPLAVNNLRAIAMSVYPTTSVNETPDERIPRSFSLAQNYPNPFNPSTNISYQLPAATDAKLVVFDILGREVATLVNGVEDPGYKSVEWNAAGVATGVYFYRLTAGDFVQTRKLLVLR